jgi:hypothetical protein
MAYIFYGGEGKPSPISFSKIHFHQLIRQRNQFADNLKNLILPLGSGKR